MTCWHAIWAGVCGQSYSVMERIFTVFMLSAKSAKVEISDLCIS